MIHEIIVDEEVSIITPKIYLYGSITTYNTKYTPLFQFI